MPTRTLKIEVIIDDRDRAAFERYHRAKYGHQGAPADGSLKADLFLAILARKNHWRKAPWGRK